MAQGDSIQVRFDAFELDEKDARLSREGSPVALVPKAFAVLCAPSRRSGSCSRCVLGDYPQARAIAERVGKMGERYGNPVLPMCAYLLGGMVHAIQAEHRVMLATNELLSSVALAFCLAAVVMWLAPRPTRAVDMTQHGH